MTTLAGSSSGAQAPTLKEVFIAIPVMALIIFCTRAFSFVLFSKGQAPDLFRYVGKYLPPLVITLLILYTLKDIPKLSLGSESSKLR